MYTAKQLNYTLKSASWRNVILQQDKYTCQICKKTLMGKYLEAHHILPRRDFRELEYDLNNGITLCKPCHKKTKWKEMFFVDFFLKRLTTEVNSSAKELESLYKNKIPTEENVLAEIIKNKIQRILLIRKLRQSRPK